MKRTHTGWSAEEDKLLLDAVRSAKNAHTSLQAAFETVADVTERRPNSVRNRYYAELRDAKKSEPLFQPFTDSESDALIRAVLLARAGGRCASWIASTREATTCSSSTASTCSRAR